MTARTRLTASLITNAIEAWTKAGQPGKGLEIAPDGTTRVLATAPQAEQAAGHPDDPFDFVDMKK
jgi:hypothetical protein